MERDERIGRGGGRRLLGPLIGIGLVLATLAPGSDPARAALTFTVNTTADHDDGACQRPPAGDCTLREAIIRANFLFGRDTIAFAIPGRGVRTIRPTAQLPAITDPLVIDGYTQPGATVNTAAEGTNARLRVALAGTALPQPPQPIPGLQIQTDDSTVRGLMITDFPSFGIAIDGIGASGHVVEGTFLGINPARSAARGNGAGILVAGTGNRVGGPTPASRNLIAANTTVGVFLDGDANRVLGNLIGTDPSGANARGNTFEGILIDGSANRVEANVVAFNGTAGVAVDEDGAGNRILANAIFANRDLGIDLLPAGPTTNDGGSPPDADAGANNRQNVPLLASATASDAKTVVAGTLDSTPLSTFVVQLFANPQAAGAEGRTFLAERLVTTDAAGHAVFTIPLRGQRRVPPGQAITATATGRDTGDSSELSPPRTVRRAR